MSRWGMGMTSSDEFMDVYESFMERYDNGENVKDISESVLHEYLEEFSYDDPILCDVFFALAKAEWMCGEQSREILDKIDEIIEKDTEITFLRELGATESDLKKRKMTVNKFRESLNVPRESPKKRKPIQAAPCADLDKGTCFWYTVNGGRHYAIVLDKLTNGSCKFIFVVISKEITENKKSMEKALGSEVGTAAWFCSLLPANRVHIIGTVPVSESYNGRAGLYLDNELGICFCENVGMNWYGNGNHFTYPGMYLRDFLNAENVPVKFVNQLQLKQMIQNAKKWNKRGSGDGKS